MEEVETTFSVAGETKVRLMLALVVTEFFVMSQISKVVIPTKLMAAVIVTYRRRCER
jgi:hypothetical protein